MTRFWAAGMAALLLAFAGLSAPQAASAGAALGPAPAPVMRGYLDPQFREKVSEITALYLQPPPDAVVLSIDEKTGMQALERRFPDVDASDEAHSAGQGAE